jgi:hypothetical protein
MEKQASLMTRKSAVWKTILGFSILIIFFFWVGVLTDYSWYYNWVSILYSVIVLSTSVTSFVMSFSLGRLQRVPIILVCLLSFPVALAGIPLHRYHSHQTPVQVAISPDGTRFIEVYCSFTRAHNDGFDHIEIVTRHKRAPFLQRDLGLYNNYVPRHCKFNTDVLVRWEDANTIYVIERQAYISVDTIKLEGVLANPGEIDGNK